METPKDNLSTTNKAHWQYTTGKSIYKLTPSNTYCEYFDRYLPRNKNWTVLEIGACPGSHLLAISLSHGFKPFALDYISEVCLLPPLFADYGIYNLSVIEADFLNFETDQKFNVVMSFGFLEHFKCPEDILLRHWKLVAPGGYLLVAVPIFGSLQMALRRAVLTSEELNWTLCAHNLEIMNLQVLTNLCNTLPDIFEIPMASHIRQMEMWFSPSSSYVRKNRVWILYFWRIVSLIPKWLNISSKFFSPYALVISRRK